ncbi:hypothetical protein [Rhodococcoides kroppenstedtii]|uniref:hypothetical protein n=1 Tax=Rhodococcoides kroppenstedtii TaxID=293050 RepID=UPI00364245C2
MMAEQAGQKVTRRPGIGTALAAVPFLGLLAGMRYEWWSYPSPADLILNLGTVWLGLLGLTAVGIFWAIRLYRYRRRSGKLAWQILVAPVVVAVAALLFVTIDLPDDRDFDRASGGMQDLAVSMLQDGRDTAGETTVDGVSFSTVYVGKDDCVYFVDRGRNDALSRAGWLYAGQCSPNPNAFRRLDPLTGDWFAFEQES